MNAIQEIQNNDQHDRPNFYSQQSELRRDFENNGRTENHYSQSSSTNNLNNMAQNINKSFDNHRKPKTNYAHNGAIGSVPINNAAPGIIGSSMPPGLDIASVTSYDRTDSKNIDINNYEISQGNFDIYDDNTNMNNSLDDRDRFDQSFTRNLDLTLTSENNGWSTLMDHSNNNNNNQSESDYFGDNDSMIMPHLEDLQSGKVSPVLQLSNFGDQNGQVPVLDPSIVASQKSKEASETREANDTNTNKKEMNAKISKLFAGPILNPNNDFALPDFGNNFKLLEANNFNWLLALIYMFSNKIVTPSNNNKSDNDGLTTTTNGLGFIDKIFLKKYCPAINSDRPKLGNSNHISPFRIRQVNQFEYLVSFVAKDRKEKVMGPTKIWLETSATNFETNNNDHGNPENKREWKKRVSNLKYHLDFPWPSPKGSHTKGFKDHFNNNTLTYLILEHFNCKSKFEDANLVSELRTKVQTVLINKILKAESETFWKSNDYPKKMMEAYNKSRQKAISNNMNLESCAGVRKHEAIIRSLRDFSDQDLRMNNSESGRAIEKFHRRMQIYGMYLPSPFKSKAENYVNNKRLFRFLSATNDTSGENSVSNSAEVQENNDSMVDSYYKSLEKEEKKNGQSFHNGSVAQNIIGGFRLFFLSR